MKKFSKAVDDFLLRQISFFHFHVSSHKINPSLFQFTTKKNEKKETFIDKLHIVVCKLKE